jgi:hypothetical protein
VVAGGYRGRFQQELVSFPWIRPTSGSRLSFLSHPTDAFYSMISYPNYKFIFPVKALGMYARRFGDLEVKY